MKLQTYSPAMLTDLYELTMAEVYFRRGMDKPATFSLFIREYPKDRGYFVSAGLEDLLDLLESIRFSAEDIDYLESTGFFSDGFLEYLAGFRFTGEVAAIPEGRLFFKDEPVVEVTAPIIEAQLVETAVINTIHLQTMMATKAARCVHAARGRGIVDFALRRTQGAEAGMAVARTGYIAGMKATSNVLAGKRYGIPVSGTMAHSFITSFKEEIDAFRAFAEIFGDRTVLLIDTYETITGAQKAVEVAREMKEKGQKLRGVRLDSGDMASLSREVRNVLDREDFEDVSIFASGGFDEFKIEQCLGDGGAINAFGVGTKNGVSADAPYSDMAYKLVQYDDRPVMKLSSGKKTLVAPKQVFRQKLGDHFVKDTIALRDELLDGEPLLNPVMRHGKRIDAAEPLNVIRKRFEAEFKRLADAHKANRSPDEYPVALSERLEALQREVKHRVINKELGES